MSDPDLRPRSVTEFTAALKAHIEDGFPAVAVEGELSNVRAAASGHLYFTLRDEGASVACVMFRGRAGALSFDPADGQQVTVFGPVSVYAVRGQYQIIVERIQLAGIGRILAAIEERKHRLAAEGLFDDERKVPLPLLPARVAVVTSPTGAAIRDILNVLGRRNAGVNLVVCPTLVQGSGAAEQIARMIRIADRHDLGDVIIVTRGGGSIEDLLPFSEEVVVRAIAEATHPVISAVGHEIDVALSDLAADYRAPTPSAAAEVVAASREELQQRVHTLGGQIVSTFLNRHRNARMLLAQFSPETLHTRYRVLVQPLLQRLDDARESMLIGLQERLSSRRHRLDLSRQLLATCDPSDVLRRGYAVVRDSNGKVLRQASAVSTGDAVAVRLHEGSLESTVTSVHGEKS